MTFEKKILGELQFFAQKFNSPSVSSEINNYKLTFFSGPKTFTLDFSPQNITVYYLLEQKEKLAAVVKSKLGLNKKIFARKCALKKIDNSVAAEFLDKNHLLASTACAYSYGLTYENDLVAVATFSKGRKMNRLPANERSFELIRFCTSPGITVTGGLTRLLKFFCEEKKAGDIMTYVDRQFSKGEAFLKAGFQKHSITAENYFLYDLTSGLLQPLKFPHDAEKDGKTVILRNEGNIKMIYTPN